MALQCLAHQFIDIFKHLPSIQVFADLPNLQASVSPPATIPPEVMLTSYRPDFVFYNNATQSIALLELTCPLDSVHLLESARSRKQNKLEYQQLLADLDRLNITNYYETLEISVLGHYHPFCLTNLLQFLHQDLQVSKASVRKILDSASQKCITASQRIFMARDCCEWFPASPN